jgi:hypothetical protein
LKKIVSIGILVDSASRGVVFRLRISPRIRSQNRNGSKRSEMDLCRTGLCKNPRKSPSLPCPFNHPIIALTLCTADLVRGAGQVRGEGGGGDAQQRQGALRNPARPPPPHRHHHEPQRAAGEEASALLTCYLSREDPM